MKKLFTFIVAATATISAMAQHSAAMTFVGKANFYVTMGGQKMGETNIPSDTIIYSGADFIIPSMNYNGSVIPSFTIKGTTFSGGMNGVTWADQPFETTVTVDGTEKTIKGSSLTGTYTRANNIHKLRCYHKNGYYEGINFFVTMESDGRMIDYEEAEMIIKRYCL